MKIRPKGMAFIATLAGLVALGTSTRRSSSSSYFDDPNPTGLPPHTPYAQPSPALTPPPPRPASPTPYAQPSPATTQPPPPAYYGYVDENPTSLASLAPVTSAYGWNVRLPNGTITVWLQTTPPPEGTELLYRWLS